MKCSLTKLITPSSEYDVSSITWHQWHHTAESESSTGLPVSFASRKASSPHSRHLISCARLGRGEKWNFVSGAVIDFSYSRISRYRAVTLGIVYIIKRTAWITACT